MKALCKRARTLLLISLVTMLVTSAFCIKLECKFNPGEVNNYKMSMGIGFEVNVPGKSDASGEYNFSGNQEIKVLKIDENKNGVLEQTLSSPNILLTVKTSEPNKPPQEMKYIVTEKECKAFINGVEQQGGAEMQKALTSAFNQKTQVTMAPNGKFVGFQSLTSPLVPEAQTPTPSQQTPAQPGPSPSAVSPQQDMQEKLAKQLSDFIPAFPSENIDVGYQWSNEIDLTQLLQTFGVMGDLGKIKIDSKFSSLDEKYGEKSANIISTIKWNADNKMITSLFGVLNFKKFAFTGTSLQNFGYEKGKLLAVSFNANLDADITLTPMGTQEPPQDLKLKLNLNFKQDLEKKM